MKPESRWQLKRGVFWIDTENDAALFYHFGNRSLIEGPQVRSALRAVFDLLHGAHTLRELEEKLADLLVPAAVRECFKALSSAGFLVEVPDVDRCLVDAADGDETEFLGNFFPSKGSAAIAQRKFRKAPILVLGQDAGRPGDFGAQLAGALVRARVGEVDHAKDEDEALSFLAAHPAGDCFPIVVGDWLRPSFVKKWNRFFLRQGTRWLLVVPDDFGGALGPYFGIKDGPCFECLLVQREPHVANLEKHRRCVAFFEQPSAPVPLVYPGFLRSLSEATVFEVLKILVAPVRSQAHQGVVDFDYLNHRTEFHGVLPAPHCEACQEGRSRSRERSS